MKGVSVKEFQIEYPLVNLKLSKDKKAFDKVIIGIHTAELERGFIVKKINKTTKKGTKVTYKACESDKEVVDYIKKVNSLIEEFEKNYNTKLGFRLTDK